MDDFIFKWELICLHTSISIVSSQLNSFNSCCLTHIILFNINPLLVDSEVISNYSIRETWVQSQVASYQRLYKWHLITPCLTLSNIRYVSRVKWSNPGKGIVPSPAPQCNSYWKGSLLVALDFTDYPIQDYSFICIQLNGSKYCYVIPKVQFSHTVKKFQYCYVTQIIVFNITHLSKK